MRCFMGLNHTRWRPRRKAGLRDPGQVARLKARVQLEVERVIWDERQGLEAERLLDQLDERLRLDAIDDSFATTPADVHVRRLCIDLGLWAADVEDDYTGEELEFDAAPHPSEFNST